MSTSPRPLDLPTSTRLNTSLPHRSLPEQVRSLKISPISSTQLIGLIVSQLRGATKSRDWIQLVDPQWLSSTAHLAVNRRLCSRLIVLVEPVDQSLVELVLQTFSGSGSTALNYLGQELVATAFNQPDQLPRANWLITEPLDLRSVSHETLFYVLNRSDATTIIHENPEASVSDLTHELQLVTVPANSIHSSVDFGQWCTVHPLTPSRVQPAASHPTVTPLFIPMTTPVGAAMVEDAALALIRQRMTITKAKSQSGSQLKTRPVNRSVAVQVKAPIPQPQQYVEVHINTPTGTLSTQQLNPVTLAAPLSSVAVALTHKHLFTHTNGQLIYHGPTLPVSKTMADRSDFVNLSIYLRAVLELFYAPEAVETWLNPEYSAIWLQAFRHISVDYENNYEPLETVGDEQMKPGFKSYLRDRDATYGSAELTNLSNFFLSKDFQYRLGSALNMQHWITYDPIIDLTASIIEDLTESFIGALCQINNLSRHRLTIDQTLLVSHFFRTIFAHIEFGPRELSTNPTSLLDQIGSALHFGKPSVIPTYETTTGQARIKCTLNWTPAGRDYMARHGQKPSILGYGTGTTQDIAKSRAYDNAFERISAEPVHNFRWFERQRYLQTVGELNPGLYQRVIEVINQRYEATEIDFKFPTDTKIGGTSYCMLLAVKRSEGRSRPQYTKLFGLIGTKSMPEVGNRLIAGYLESLEQSKRSSPRA